MDMKTGSILTLGAQGNPRRITKMTATPRVGRRSIDLHVQFEGADFNELTIGIMPEHVAMILESIAKLVAQQTAHNRQFYTTKEYR